MKIVLHSNKHVLYDTSRACCRQLWVGRFTFAAAALNLLANLWIIGVTIEVKVVLYVCSENRRLVHVNEKLS